MTRDEDEPRRQPVHQLGEKLDDLSVHEFDERIALLRGEIERLEQARRVKVAAMASASSVFGTRSP